VENVLIQPPAARVKVTGPLPKVAWESHRRFVRRHWGWLAVLFAVTLIGALVGDLIPGLWYVAAVLVIGGIKFAVGRRASERVHEIEHGGSR
jgi:fatty acid desaturase